MFGIPENTDALIKNTRAVNAQTVAILALTKALDKSALSETLSIVRSLQSQGVQVMSKIDDLKAAVAASDAVVQSAIVLINGIAAALQAAIDANDPAAMQAVIDDLNANKEALAAAVDANTTPAT